MIRKFVLLLGVALLCGFGCTRKPETLTIGIIKPSIDHLPLSYGLGKGWIDKARFVTVPFSSGWELQEAMVGGRIDVGIIPFSYVWNLAGSGFPVKTVSFFERETDGVLVQKEILTSSDLNGKKVGMLKGSTLDVLWQDYAASEGIVANPVYFRTPNEMIAGMQNGELSAAVLYVPLLNKLEKDYSVLHWFSEKHPLHPCCDLAVNTSRLSGHKEKLFRQFYFQLSSAVEKMDYSAEDFTSFMQDNYGLSGAELKDALLHTRFEMGLSESGKAFQRKMAIISLSSGYLEKMPDDNDVYWDINAR